MTCGGSSHREKETEPPWAGIGFEHKKRTSLSASRRGNRKRTRLASVYRIYHVILSSSNGVAATLSLSVRRTTSSSTTTPSTTHPHAATRITVPAASAPDQTAASHPARAMLAQLAFPLNLPRAAQPAPPRAPWYPAGHSSLSDSRIEGLELEAARVDRGEACRRHAADVRERVLKPARRRYGASDIGSGDCSPR